MGAAIQVQKGSKYSSRWGQPVMQQVQQSMGAAIQVRRFPNIDGHRIGSRHSKESGIGAGEDIPRIPSFGNSHALEERWMLTKAFRACTKPLMMKVAIWFWSCSTKQCCFMVKIHHRSLLHRLASPILKTFGILAALYLFICSLTFLSTAFRILGGRNLSNLFHNSQIQNLNAFEDGNQFRLSWIKRWYERGGAMPQVSSKDFFYKWNWGWEEY